MVRQILEYAAAIWNPHRKKNIKALEKVQRNFTKQINELKGLEYRDRL
jgi:hypothetical protein